MAAHFRFGWLLLVGVALADSPVQPLVMGREVSAIVFTSNGKRLFAGAGNEVRVLDAVSGKELRKFTAHDQGVRGLALSPDGKTLATAGAGSAGVCLWEVGADKERHARTIGKDVATAVAFAPNGKTLAWAGGDGGIQIWDLENGKLLRGIATGDTWAMSLAFSPDGKRLYTAGSTMNALAPGFRVNDGDEARAWEVETGKNVSRAPAKGTSLAVAADGGVLAIGGFGLVLVGPGEPANIRINQVGFRPQYRTTLWNVSANREIMHLDGLGTVALSADGRYLAAARGVERNYRPRGGVSIGGGIAGNAPPQLIEVTSGKPVLSLTPPAGAVATVAFSPDALRLALGMSDGTVHLLELAPPGFKPATARTLTPEQLASQWDILGGDNATAAQVSLWTLSAAGDAALAGATDRLRPRKADAARIGQLLKDLDSRRFVTRDAAFKELQKLGDSVEGDIRKALKGEPSVDARKKLEELAGAFDRSTLNSEHLMQSRGILVLERIGTPKARELLQEVSRGQGESFAGREARAALGRLETRP